MGRELLEEFVRNGKNFLYIDFSDFRSNKDFLEAINEIQPEIAKFPENSLYTITNISDVKFDTESKELVAKYMEHNKPYVKRGAVVGLDGIKKVMVEMIFKLSGRSNMIFAYTKEQAIELLLEEE